MSYNAVVWEADGVAGLVEAINQAVERMSPKPVKFLLRKTSKGFEIQCQ